MCAFIFSDVSISNMLGAFLNFVTWLNLLMLDLVLYLCVLVISAIVQFLEFTPLLGSHGAAVLVCPFLFFQFLFLANFPFFCETADFLLG